MSLILIACQNCGGEAFAEPREINRGNGKFCSLICSAIYNAGRTKTPDIQCNWCQKFFHRRPSRQRTKLMYCSRICKDKAQSINGLPGAQPSHYGKGCGINEYRRKAFKHYPHQCNRCSYDDPRALIVHHKDRNRRNNVLPNLEILCCNCHGIEHH